MGMLCSLHLTRSVKLIDYAMLPLPPHGSKIVDLAIPFIVGFAYCVVRMHLHGTVINGCFICLLALHGRARLGATVRRSI